MRHNTPILAWLVVAAVVTGGLSVGVPAQAALHVVATTTDLADFTRTVGGDGVDVTTICKGAQDPHYLQAKPSYMLLVNRADLVVAVGLELEVGWLPGVLQGARNPRVAPGQPGYLEVGELVARIDVPSGPLDRSMGDVHPRGNPHFWLDPDNATIAVRGIAERLAQLDAAGAARYRRNAQEFAQRMATHMVRWSLQLAPYKGRSVVTYHRTFNYFLRRFGLVGAAYIEERPGIPPGPAYLSGLMEHMRADRVPLILHEATFDPAASRMVAERTGAKLAILPTSVDGAPGTASYAQLMDLLVHAVATELQASKP